MKYRIFYWDDLMGFVTKSEKGRLKFSMSDDWLNQPDYVIRALRHVAKDCLKHEIGIMSAIKCLDSNFEFIRIS